MIKIELNERQREIREKFNEKVNHYFTSSEMLYTVMHRNMVVIPWNTLMDYTYELIKDCERIKSQKLDFLKRIFGKKEKKKSFYTPHSVILNRIRERLELLDKQYKNNKPAVIAQEVKK